MLQALPGGEISKLAVIVISWVAMFGRSSIISANKPPCYDWDVATKTTVTLVHRGFPGRARMAVACHGAVDY